MSYRFRIRPELIVLSTAALLLCWGNAANPVHGQSPRDTGKSARSSRPATQNRNDRPGPEKPSQKTLEFEELIKLALKHNPDIRAAEARYRLAQAELERTRLEVVKGVSRYQAEKRFAMIAVKYAEAELQKGREVNQKVPGAISATELKRLDLEVEKAKAMLRKLDTELPYLLGRGVNVEQKPGPAGKTAKRQRQQPRVGDREAEKMATQIFQTKIKAFQRSKNADVDGVAKWSNRILKNQLRNSQALADRIAAVDAHMQRLEHLRRIASTRFDAGIGPRQDVLIIEYHQLEAGRTLRDEKSAAR